MDLRTDNVLDRGGHVVKSYSKSVLSNKSLTGFRDFVLRGNVVDLAVGVVIGAAFAALIGAFGKSFLNPLIALIVGSKHCAPGVTQNCNIGAHFTVRGENFLYGDFITAVFVFLITAAVVYFFVVRPINALMERFNKDPEPQAPTKDCPECLSVIPELATRCASCGVKQPVPPVAPEPVAGQPLTAKSRTTRSRTTKQPTP